jgi:hypothetical protein
MTRREAGGPTREARADEVFSARKWPLGGWSALNLTTEGAPPFRVCFLKGWAILGEVASGEKCKEGGEWRVAIRRD